MFSIYCILGVYVEEIIKFLFFVVVVEMVILVFIGYIERVIEKVIGDLIGVVKKIMVIVEYDCYYGGLDIEIGFVV